MKRIPWLQRSCAVLALLLMASTVALAASPADEGPFAVGLVRFPDLADAARDGRNVPMQVLVPSGQGPFPLVVVSHGAGGNWNANYAQAHHLASHGFVVICLEHVGSNTSTMRRLMSREGGRLTLKKAMLQVTRDPAEVLQRPRDVSFALDMAEQWNRAPGALKGRIDMGSVGVLGHSYGAYTTLAVCGVRPILDWLEPSLPPGRGPGPDLADSRVRYGVALSPQGPSSPFFGPGSYGSAKVPLLLVTGSRDAQQTGDGKRIGPEDRRRAFEALPPGDKYFLWLEGAEHLDFSDPTGNPDGARPLRSSTREDVQRITRRATLLFCLYAGRGDAEARAKLVGEDLEALVTREIRVVKVEER